MEFFFVGFMIPKKSHNKITVQGGALFLRDSKAQLENVEISVCDAKYGGKLILFIVCLQ
jgi:hypothetical protein